MISRYILDISDNPILLKGHPANDITVLVNKSSMIEIQSLHCFLWLVVTSDRFSLI